MASGKEYEVVEVGFMTPEKKTVDVLRAGEVRAQGRGLICSCCGCAGVCV
jgi:translation elongation factor EF-4